MTTFLRIKGYYVNTDHVTHVRVHTTNHRVVGLAVCISGQKEGAIIISDPAEIEAITTYLDRVSVPQWGAQNLPSVRS